MAFNTALFLQVVISLLCLYSCFSYNEVQDGEKKRIPLFFCLLFSVFWPVFFLSYVYIRLFNPPFIFSTGEDKNNDEITIGYSTFDVKDDDAEEDDEDVL